MGSARPVAFLSFAVATAMAAIAHAETYKWVDAQGRIQYTDRLPPEAVNRGNVELSKQGVARKVTDAAMTPEQRKAIEDRVAREREAERIAKERQLQDNALLASYTSEDDIEVARKRNLNMINVAILAAETRIKTLQKRAEAIEREKLFYEKKSFPEKLKRELADVQAEIPRQHMLIAGRNADALAVNQRFDETRQKYLDLRTRMAAQMHGGAQRR